MLYSKLDNKIKYVRPQLLITASVGWPVKEVQPMPIYKILRLDSHRHAPLSGIVESEYHAPNKYERWHSLEEALNELAEAGWEVDTPIYGPVPGRGHEGETWLEGLILVNRSANTAQEIRRQIEKVERRLTEERRALESGTVESSMEKVKTEQSVKELSSILEELRKYQGEA